MNKLLEPINDLKESIIDNFPDFFWGVVLFAILVLIGYGISLITKRRLNRKMDDVLLINFIGRVIWAVFGIIGLMLFLNAVGLGNAAGSLLAGAGVSAIILGFAFKDIGENFLAGFFLAFSRPFGIGDLIEVTGIKGTVRAMNFRNTHVRTFDGQDIFIPNASLIKNPLSNYTRDNLLRHNFVLGIDFGDDISKAIKTVLERLSEMSELEQTTDLKPFVMIESFGTSTINLGVYYWINSAKQSRSVISIKNETMAAGLEALTKSGFSLPADIVELKIYQEGQPIPIRNVS